MRRELPRLPDSPEIDFSSIVTADLCSELIFGIEETIASIEDQIAAAQIDLGANEAAWPDDDRDWLRRARFALKAHQREKSRAAQLRMKFQIRDKHALKMERVAKSSKGQSENSQIFVQAAKKLLTGEMFVAIWDEARKMGAIDG